MEGEKQYTPEEIADLKKSRAISDASLLQAGASYEPSESAGPDQMVVPTEVIEHIKWTKDEIDKEIKLIEGIGNNPELKNIFIVLRNAVNSAEINPVDKEGLLKNVEGTLRNWPTFSRILESYKERLKEEFK